MASLEKMMWWFSCFCSVLFCFSLHLALSSAIQDLAKAYSFVLLLFGLCIYFLWKHNVYRILEWWIFLIDSFKTIFKNCNILRQQEGFNVLSTVVICINTDQRSKTIDKHMSSFKWMNYVILCFSLLKFRVRARLGI